MQNFSFAPCFSFASPCLLYNFPWMQKEISRQGAKKQRKCALQKPLRPGPFAWNFRFSYKVIKTEISVPYWDSLRETLGFSYKVIIIETSVPYSDTLGAISVWTRISLINWLSWCFYHDLFFAPLRIRVPINCSQSRKGSPLTKKSIFEFLSHPCNPFHPPKSMFRQTFFAALPLRAIIFLNQD